MTKTSVVTAALLAGVLGVAACNPVKKQPPPPPPPTQPKDVLIVGDSVGFGVACLLGDNGTSSTNCPAQPDFTAKNATLGSCNISGRDILGYNNSVTGFGQVLAGGCPGWGFDWQLLVDKHGPKLAVIVTGGWEIPDRWTNTPSCTPYPLLGPNCSPAPDLQWGGASYQAVAQRYASKLNTAIHILGSRGGKVLVFNAVYSDPKFPLVPGNPNTEVWWEPMSATAPVQGQGGYLRTWRAPVDNIVYRSGKNKVDQYNLNQQVIKTFYDNNPGLLDGIQLSWFNFWAPFAPNGTYSRQVCPPWSSSNPDPSGCPDVCPADGTSDKVVARNIDDTHFVPAGNQVLGYHLIPLVRGLLGLTPGPPPQPSC